MRDECNAVDLLIPALSSETMVAVQHHPCAFWTRRVATAGHQWCAGRL